MKKRKCSLLLPLIVLLTAEGCSDHVPVASELPQMTVVYRIDLASSEGAAIASPLTALAVTTPRTSADRLGIAGLIIVHALDAEISTQGYAAMDAQCPLCYPSTAAVSPDERPHEGTLLSASCPRCGAVYDLTFGLGNRVAGGRGERPAVLKRYRISLSDHFLLVSN